LIDTGYARARARQPLCATFVLPLCATFVLLSAISWPSLVEPMEIALEVDFPSENGERGLIRIDQMKSLISGF
jgi:hypothetical protein